MLSPKQELRHQQNWPWGQTWFRGQKIITANPEINSATWDFRKVSLHDVMANMLDFDNVVSEFELQSRYLDSLSD